MDREVARRADELAEAATDQECTSTLLDEMVTEAGALGLYESTAEPRPTR